MKAVLLLCLLSVAFAVCHAHEHHEPQYPMKGNKALPKSSVEIETTFQEFVRTHARAYAVGSAEYAQRLAYFTANVKEIEATRANHLQAVFNINKFADMSPQELRGLRMKPQPAADLARSCLANGVDQVQRDELLEKARSAGPAPKTFSWVDQGKVTPVKNQAQCGSCWAFSTVGSIESAWAIKYNKLVGLSEQEIVDCSHGCANEPPYGSVCNQGCNGGWPWAAMSDLVSWKGMATEAQYPYVGVTGVCNQNNKTMVSSPISNYTCLSGSGQQGDGPASEDDMLTFSYANGPLSIAMDATPLQWYEGGVVDPYSWNPFSGCGQTQLDHAILIVGWGTYQSDLWGEQPYWLVRNSWGADWGEGGYFKLFRGANMCGCAAAVTFPIVA